MSNDKLAEALRDAEAMMKLAAATETTLARIATLAAAGVQESGHE